MFIQDRARRISRDRGAGGNIPGDDRAGADYGIRSDRDAGKNNRSRSYQNIVAHTYTAAQCRAWRDVDAVAKRAFVVYRSPMVDDARFADPRFRCNHGMSQHLASSADGCGPAETRIRVYQRQHTQTVPAEQREDLHTVLPAVPADRYGARELIEVTLLRCPSLESGPSVIDRDAGQRGRDFKVVKQGDYPATMRRYQLREYLGVPGTAPEYVVSGHGHLSASERRP